MPSLHPGSGKSEAIAVAAKFEPVFSQGTLIILIALLLGETTINFIDRQVVSVLAPVLRKEFSLSNGQYAAIVNAFMATYGVALPLAGMMLDRLGVGRGLTLAVSWWSLVGMATSLVQGPLSLGAMRSLLATGEAAAWPGFAKATATWVPVNARTMVIGICNSGSSMGAMIAPPLVVGAMSITGWRGAFIATGAIGFAWVLAFYLFRRAHPEMATSERLNVTQQGRVQWATLLKYRQAWVVFFCRFLADPLWFFYVFWIPEFLSKHRGLNMTEIAAVAWIPFLVADASNFTGGFLTMKLQQAGWSINSTRKTVMTAGALLSPIGILAVFADSVFWTIGCISIAIFFWMWWSVSVHTLAGDYFPPRAVGRVYGIGGTGSTLGSVISTWAVGRTLDVTGGNYTPVFVGIGMLMPVALIVGLSLMGRVEQVALTEE